MLTIFLFDELLNNDHLSDAVYGCEDSTIECFLCSQVILTTSWLRAVIHSSVNG
jgi:hypothetical protein